MLLIKHYVAPSKIDGLGVFSAVLAKKGTIIWQFNSIVDRLIHKDELETLPDHVSVLVKRNSEYFPKTECFILGGDGDQYMNHSENPSIRDHHDPAIQENDIPLGIAVQDIHPGDEITCDYRECVVLGSHINTMANIFAQKSDATAPTDRTK